MYRGLYRDYSGGHECIGDYIRIIEGDTKSVDPLPKTVKQGERTEAGRRGSSRAKRFTTEAPSQGSI